MNMLPSFRRLYGFALAVMVSACGGGGASDTATITSFACDEAAALARAEKITVDATKPVVQYPEEQLVTFEDWPVRINGRIFNLKVRVAMPKAGLSVKGVWLESHGISGYNFITLIKDIPRSFLESRAASLGYIVLTVARRGDFGSSFGSEALPGSPDNIVDKLTAQYRLRQITYSQLDDGLWGYQADSIVGAMDYIKTDARIAPYLDTIVLTGFSGGAETLLYAAAKSPVFLTARNKALIRGAGRDSALDTNPEAAPGGNESKARLASSPGMVPALWYGGTADPLTSASKLACEYGFYNSRNGAGSKFTLINGMGHGGAQMETAEFQNVVTAYLRSRSIPGF